MKHDCYNRMENGRTDDEISSAQCADYIASHLKELVGVARRNRMSRLVYFMEMAQLEAQELARQIDME